MGQARIAEYTGLQNPHRCLQYIAQYSMRMYEDYTGDLGIYMRSDRSAKPQSGLFTRFLFRNLGFRV